MQRSFKPARLGVSAACRAVNVNISGKEGRRVMMTEGEGRGTAGEGQVITEHDWARPASCLQTYITMTALFILNVEI